MNDLEMIISDYLNYSGHHKNLNAKTLKAYSIDLKQFQQYMFKEKLNYSDHAALVQYISEIRKNYKPKTIKRKLASIKAFYRYMELKNLLNFNPFNKIIDIDIQETQQLPKTIPLPIIQAFFTTLYNQKKNALTDSQKRDVLRDIAVIELLFTTGVRISELCAIKFTDVDIHKGNLFIYGKGAKERKIQIGYQGVIQALTEYSEEFYEDIKQSGYFFVNRLKHQMSEQSVRYMIDHYAELACLGFHITPRMFRNSFATLLLEQDVDLQDIQKMMGHSSIMTTEIYTRVLEKRKKDALVSKNPRNLISLL